MDLISSPVFRLSKMEVDSDLDMGEFGLRAASVHGKDLSGGGVKLTSGDATVDADGVATLVKVGSARHSVGVNVGSATVFRRLVFSGNSRFADFSGDFIVRVSRGVSNDYYGNSWGTVVIRDSFAHELASLAVNRSPTPTAFAHLDFTAGNPLEFEITCSVTGQPGYKGWIDVEFFANRSVHESVGCYGIPADDLNGIVSGVGLSLEEVTA